MPAARRVTILLDERDPYPDQRSHLVWFIAEAWRKQDIEVVVCKGLAGGTPGNGLLLPHLDRTIVPDAYRAFIATAPNALNAGLNDISKRRISRNLVSPGDAYAGPVIVKTDANCGGRPELAAAPIARRVAARLGNLGGLAHVRSLESDRYPVFDSIDQVPPGVWNNPRLVVEKYVPERDGRHYCIRVCFFLGSVEYNRRLYARTRVVKGGSVLKTERARIPQALRRIRERLGLDYGKLDYVMHGGRVHLLDVNRTPGLVADDRVNRRIADKLAAGAEAWL
jgi:hypothetical protein